MLNPSFCTHRQNSIFSGGSATGKVEEREEDGILIVAVNLGKRFIASLKSCRFRFTSSNPLYPWIVL